MQRRLTFLDGADFTAFGYTGGHVLRDTDMHDVLPYSFRYLVPAYASFIGLGAIASAVMSSAGASALSAASLFTRNVYFNVMRPTASSDEMAAAVRMSVCLFGATTTAMALDVRSIYTVWNLSADIVYVLLFPQLVCLFYLAELTNTYGVLAGFFVGLLLRTFCGEPLINAPALLRLPLCRTVCMIASFSCTVGVSYASRNLFARRVLPDFLGCFVVVGEDDQGRYLVRSGLGSISEPLAHKDAAVAAMAGTPVPTTSAGSDDPEFKPDAETPATPAASSTMRSGSRPAANNSALAQVCTTSLWSRDSMVPWKLPPQQPCTALEEFAENAMPTSSSVPTTAEASAVTGGGHLADVTAVAVSPKSSKPRCLPLVEEKADESKGVPLTPKKSKATKRDGASKKGAQIRAPSSASTPSSVPKRSGRKRGGQPREPE
ncbi:hypothetical protein HPB51_022993 [Rhipicephalus microplus]|uniref:Uncharacterized protein n=1 Tax=Rhipicephalus microplus TaxID=6941 RepID=A0A9J6D780_RHIMP|nr:hypothetical protein HPB51_022993 [Rhipicephalus microplus]